MNLSGVALFLIIVVECDFWETVDSLKLSPPWINVVKDIGDSYSVKCEGKGQKTWRDDDGQPINGHSRPWKIIQESEHALTLRFTNIRKEDKGVYNCTVKAENRKRTVGFELIVIQKLSLVTNATTEMKIVKPGDDVTLECQTEGEPPPIISWFFNDQLMQIISTAQIGEGYEKSSLPLNDITPQEDGLYTCRAFQKIRQTHDVELSFLIKVFQKPTFLYPNDGYAIVYGFRNESRNLTCAVKAYPVAYFVWYKDEKLMEVKKNGVKVYNEENTSTLEILLDDLNVLGVYECEAANSQGYLSQKIEYTMVNTPQTPRLCYYERNDTSAIISVYLEPFPTVNFTCKIEYTKSTWQQGDEKWKTAHVFNCSSQRQQNTNKIHCTIRNLQPLTKYAVRAALRNPGGIGNYSNELVFRTRSESSFSVNLRSIETFLYFCLIIHILL